MFGKPEFATMSFHADREDSTLEAEIEADTLGVTRFLSQTFVVGGRAYTSFADAMAQGRRMQQRGAGL